jgi:hypothetical protein
MKEGKAEGFHEVNKGRYGLENEYACQRILSLRN